MLTIGMVAGEASGDILGAGLIKALKQKTAEIRLIGIGGDELIAQGMDVRYPMERLAVMGITEVLGRYRELWLQRKSLLEYFLQNPPDVFIGVDAPEYNLWLERKLKAAGIKTIHFVSPSVWAWRQSRIKTIKKAVDLMLTLFPFEAKFYEENNVPHEYIGHPLANIIDFEPDTLKARAALNIDIEAPVLALLPGSRKNEISNLAPEFIRVARLCLRDKPNLQIVVAANNQKNADLFCSIKDKVDKDLTVSLRVNQTGQVLQAADVVIIASGTATLEAMLYKKPMVIAYKLSWLSYKIIKALSNISHVGLPNILAGKQVVPEYLQDDCTVENLFASTKKFLNNQSTAELEDIFLGMHKMLRKDTYSVAADATFKLIRI